MRAVHAVAQVLWSMIFSYPGTASQCSSWSLRTKSGPTGGEGGGDGCGGGGDGCGGGGDGFGGGGDGGDAGSFQTSMVRYVAPCGVTSVYVWAVGDAQNHRTLSGDDHCRYTNHDDEQPQALASQSGWQSAIDGSVGDSSMHDVAMHEPKSATKAAARIEAAGGGVRNCKLWNLFPGSRGVKRHTL